MTKNDHPIQVRDDGQSDVGMALDPSADPLLSEEMMQVREEQRDHELTFTWNNVIPSVLFVTVYLTL